MTNTPEEHDFITQVCADDAAEREPLKPSVIVCRVDESCGQSPVPPAGGEPGAVEGLRQLVIGPYPNPDVEDAHDEYLDEHQSQALWLLRNAGRIETHVTRLQAENAALQQRLNMADEENDELKEENDTLQHHVIDLKLANSDLQSELTKARELLVEGQYFGPFHWQKRTQMFLAHQSAPAAKGGE